MLLLMTDCKLCVVGCCVVIYELQTAFIMVVCSEAPSSQCVINGQ
jgi:hypothetical protein